jgi:hypothetical protein
MSTSQAGALSHPEGMGVLEHNTPPHVLAMGRAAMARRRSKGPGPAKVGRSAWLPCPDEGLEPWLVMEVIEPSPP